MVEAAVMELSDENFEQEVLNCHLPVLVDFWADWCMPCQMVAPAIEAIANEFAGRLKVGRVDVTHNRDVPTKYGVNPLPTILLFQGGEVTKEFVGVKDKHEFEAALRSAIG